MRLLLIALLYIATFTSVASASLANNGSNVIYSSGTTNLTGLSTKTISIGGWFNFKGITYVASRVFEFEAETGSDDQVFNLGLQDCTDFGGTANNLCISFGMDNSGIPIYGSVYITTSLPTTGMHHIVITWNNSSGSVASDFVFYVDGAATGTPTASFVGSSYSSSTTLTSERTNTSLFLGAGADGYVTHDYYQGTMSDLAVWNKALTSGEVSTLYNGGVQSPCSHIPAGVEAGSLIAYFPLDDYPSGIINTAPNEYAGNYSFTVDTNSGNATWSNNMSCASNHIHNTSSGNVQVNGKAVVN